MIDTDMKKKENISIHCSKRMHGCPRPFVQSTLRICRTNRKKRKEGKRKRRNERGKEEEKSQRHDCFAIRYKGVCEQVKRVLTPLNIRVDSRAEKWTLSLYRTEWDVCIMAAHGNWWLLRGKWVASQSVRCCFPVFGKELTVSFALALGPFFPVKNAR